MSDPREALARALQALRGGDAAGAAALLDHVLAQAPNDVNALHLMAAAKRQAGARDEALLCFDRALAVAPGAAPIQFNRANLLAEMGRYGDAVAGYDSALALRPDHGESHLNRARALIALERWQDALAAFDRAAASGQGGAAARERCAALAGLGRFEEALACYERRLTANAKDADAAYNRARCLMELARSDEALVAFDAALLLEPGRADIHKNRGVVLYWLGRVEASAQAFDAAQALAPDDAGIAHTKAVALLAAGDFARGWPLHEARRDPRAGLAMRALGGAEPQWRGERVRVLRIWAEQGIGDEVLFARFAPLAKARAERVLLQCADRLMPLFARAFADIDVLSVEHAAPPADAQIAIGSLPLALQAGAAELGGGAAFLKPDIAARDAIRARYAALARGRPIVGVAWMSKAARYGAHKSAALSEWGALLSKPCLFVDLQYGAHDEELAAARARFGCELVADAAIDQMADLDAFAAQVAALDQVVTVSNTTAHFAGALGVPALVLVPPAQGLLWYWGARGERTPWYASVRLVRREARRGWAEQVAAAAALLPY
jgi:tetratricopeptide (TPR) repeat protein